MRAPTELCNCGCGLPPITDPVHRIAHEWAGEFGPDRFSGYGETAKIRVTPQELEDLVDRVAKQAVADLQTRIDAALQLLASCHVTGTGRDVEHVLRGAAS